MNRKPLKAPTLRIRQEILSTFDDPGRTRGGWGAGGVKWNTILTAKSVGISLQQHQDLFPTHTGVVGLLSFKRIDALILIPDFSALKLKWLIALLALAQNPKPSPTPDLTAPRAQAHVAPQYWLWHLLPF
jgi:hypothetical protein